MEIKALLCMNCGNGFITWPKYKDQGQDEGYGFCKSCQEYFKELNNKHIEEVTATLAHGIRKEYFRN